MASEALSEARSALQKFREQVDHMIWVLHLLLRAWLLHKTPLCGARGHAPVWLALQRRPGANSSLMASHAIPHTPPDVAFNRWRMGFAY